MQIETNEHSAYKLKLMEAQKKEVPWTQFWDMHSGGGCKEKPYEKIYIQAPEEQAKVIFYNRFGHNPERVTCTCCGGDYSISESETLAQATAHHRGCDYDDKARKYVEGPSNDYRGEKYQTVDEYSQLPDVLVIPHEEIKDGERIGEVPQEGYIWH